MCASSLSEGCESFGEKSSWTAWLEVVTVLKVGCFSEDLQTNHCRC